MGNTWVLILDDHPNVFAGPDDDRGIRNVRAFEVEGHVTRDKDNFP